MSAQVSQAKPRLSFWQIWNMSFGFLGIQFGWGLQLANGSRIFQTLGVEVGDIAILWIAAPVTGLIVQPIIGYMSDRTWNKLGRRKPYFLIGAILSTIGLIVMPHSPVWWVAAGMLWILDASINISMEPFRAFVGDMLPSSQRTRGFAMQSFFIGVGSVVASMLPYMVTNWLNISNVAPEGSLSPSLKVSFLIGGIVFLIAVLWTIFSTKEYSPEEMAAFEAHEKEEGTAVAEQAPLNESIFLKTGPIWSIVGIAFTAAVVFLGLEKELLVLSIGLIVFGLLVLLTGMMTKNGNTKNGLVEVFHDLFRMPESMKQLAWVQFFTWFGLFSMFIYATPAIASHIYGTSDASSALYNEAGDWVGVLFAIYNGVAALAAFLLPPLAKKTNKRITHAISLIAGGLGLMSFYVFSDPNLLIISMIGIGIAWASILSMPYALLTDGLPAHKFGVYMGIFNFFIVLPEIVASSVYGSMLEYLFDGNPIFIILSGGVSFFIAALLVMRVNEKEE